MGRLSDQALDLFALPPAPPPISSDYPDGIPREICDLFEKLTLELVRRGLKHYSSDAVLHRIRWHYHVERGDGEFTCNNNWTSVLARWFIKHHPDLSSFFELRQRRQ